MKENTFYENLFAAKQEIGKISKDSTNPFFKSKYFDINALLEHVEPILWKHRLFVVQPIEEDIVKTEIMDEKGFGIASGMKLPNLTDPQKMGSAVTYYRRYTLQSLLALQAEDDDGNATVNQVSEVQKDWLNENTPEFSKAIEYIKNGGKIQAIQAKYKLSKKVKEQL